METLKLKAQTLHLGIDFHNETLRGSTTLSIALALPSRFGQFFQTGFIGEPPLSSGLVVPLRCPSPDVCSVTSVDVSGVPSVFTRNHDHQPLRKTSGCSLTAPGVYDLLSFDVAFRDATQKWFGSEGLCVDLPPLALHRASLRTLKPKQGSNNPKSTDAAQETITVTLKITVSFTLFRLTPATSTAFFTSHCLRLPGSSRITQYPLFVTKSDATRSHVWFPTAPGCWTGQAGDQKKASTGRCSWHCHFTVPLGMTAVGTGFLYRRSKELATTSRPYPVETFSFETRGPLSSLPASDICLFVGHFFCWSKPSTPISTGDGHQETDNALPEYKACTDNGGNQDDPVHPKASATASVAAEEQPPSQGPFLLTCITLKGPISSSYFHAVRETVTCAITALHTAYGIGYPHPQLTLLFLPVGCQPLQLGEGIWDYKLSTLTESIPHPGHSTTHWVFGGTVVFDIALLHRPSENHASIFRAKEIIAEGVLSVLFGSVWSVLPGDIAKDWWLLTAFRRYAIDHFMQSCFGAPHKAGIEWLRMELYAKLVEAGYDIAPLSVSHLDSTSRRRQADGPQDDEQLPTTSTPTTALLSSSSWFNPRSVTVGLKASFILPSLDILLTSPSQPDPPRATVNEYDPSCARWSPPTGTLTSFLSATVARAYKRGPGTLITTRRFIERLQRRLKAAFILSGAWQRCRTDSSASPLTYSPSSGAPQLAPPTIDTLDLSLYAAYPSLNIGHLLSVVEGFFDCWVFGVGCSSTSLGLFLQLQKKSASPAIESCRLRFDETPLQPPSLLDSYTGVSDYHQALLASQPILEILLEESCELESQQQQDDGHHVMLDTSLPPSILREDGGVDYRRVLANHDLASLLNECGLELICYPSTITPYELIVKDSGTGLGFGYTGRDMSPITDGHGTLHHLIETRLNSEWAMLDTDQRVLLTADTAARNALLCSQTQARTLPLALPPLYPMWLIPVAAATILRDVVRYIPFLRNCPALRSGCVQCCWMTEGLIYVLNDPIGKVTSNYTAGRAIATVGETTLTFGRPDTACLIDTETSTLTRSIVVAPNTETSAPNRHLVNIGNPSQTTSDAGASPLPRLATPLSLGFGKYYTDLLTVHVCGDRGILHDPRFLCAQELPVAFELRAFDDVGVLMRMPKLGGHHHASRGTSGTGTRPTLAAGTAYGSRTGTLRKFCGILSTADECLFANDPTTVASSSAAVPTAPNAPGLTAGVTASSTTSQSRKHLARQDGSAGTKLGRKDRAKHLPVLWMHIMGHTRPIWLARFFRCQSVGMWEQQFMNDPLTTSQLEAALALGQLACSPTVIPCLGRALRNHGAHPLVRSFSAQSLQRLHNDTSNFQSTDCLSLLLNYLYTYHYRSKASRGHFKALMENASPQAALPNPTTPRYASGQIGTAMSEDDEPMPEDTETAAPASPYMNMKHGPTATSGTPGQLLPRNPPFWMTSEMIFLRDLLTAIARLRSVDGKTVYESIDTLTQLLMHHTTDIPSKEQFNADYYIAHVISTLRHIRLAFTQCRVAVEDVARPALYRLLVSMGGPQATALHEAQRAWIHWRDDDMDSDAESLFLHVWRYYRLDHCLHSKHHVITCACLDVFSRSPMLRDLVRLKLCDETGSDFQLLAFLPLNLTPVLTQFGRWKEQHTAGSLDSVSAAVWSPYHTVSIGLLARHQLALVNALGSRDHRAAASCENTDIPGSPSCADGPALWYLMSAGVREIATSMRDQYCHYQDDNVERAALKSLLYCTAIGSLEPPLILLTRNAPVALCDIKTVEDLLVTLEWTCTTQYPASTLHARAMHQVTLLLQEGLKHQGVSVPAEQPMPGNGLLASSQPSIPLEQRNTNVSPAALESISRFLFCSRWTSPEEMDGLQRSGLSLLNAVILACRLDEVLTTPDTISHLVYIWDVFHEVLGDLLVDAPLVFIAYCMKPCRGLDDNGETQSTQQMYSAANGDTTSTSNSQPLFPPMYREERAQDFAPSQTAHSRISSSNALPIPQSESQQAADSGTFGSVHEKFLPQKKKKRRRRDHLDSYAAPQSSTVLDAAPAPVADDHSRSSHSPQYLQIKGLSTTFPATQWPKSYAVQPSHTFDSVPVAEPPASEEPSGDPHSFFQEGPSSPDAMLDADLGLDESTFSWDHRYNDEELFSGDPDSDWDTARTGPPRPEEPQRADPQCDYSSSGSFSASPGTQHSADLDSLLLRQPPTPFDDVPDTSSNADQRDPHSASVRSTLQFQHDVHTLRSPPDEHANDLSHLMVLTDGEISGDGGSHGDPEDFGVLDYGDALFISESPDFFPKDPGSPGHEFQADDIFGADEDPPHHDASPFTSYLQPAPVVLDDYAPQRVSQDGIGTAFGTSGAPPQGLPRNDLPPPPAAPGDGPTPAPQHYVYGRPLPFPPSVLCAKALWEYMQDRALRLPSVAEQRLSGVRHVYAFLFGVGLPQCLAFIHDHIQTPDPLLVDTFNANLKHGRYLRKLCLFQKRYLEDDSPEVPDWQTLAMEIVELLMSLPLASAFIDEVNHEEAPNYRAIVKEPMWLRLVQQKLQAQAYGSYHEWKNDLFLIFRNCRIFNAPESKIVQDCEALQTIVYSVLRPTEKLLSRWKATPSSPTPWGHPTDPSAC